MTTTEKAPHTLSVAVEPARCDGLAADHATHDRTCYGYSLECPGVTHRCRMWIGCELCSAVKIDSAEWDALEQDSEAHGVEHQYINGDWMVPTDRCFAAENDYLCDAAEDLQLQPGRHGVTVSFDSCEYLVLTLAESEKAGSEVSA